MKFQAPHLALVVGISALIAAIALPHLHAQDSTTTPTQPAAKKLDPAQRAQLRAARIAALAKAASESKTDLVAAIAAAKTAVDGEVVEAEMEIEDDGSLEIEVVVLKDGKVFEVEIDPTTGAVKEVEAEDEDDEDDDEDQSGKDDH